MKKYIRKCRSGDCRKYGTDLLKCDEDITGKKEKRKKIHRCAEGNYVRNFYYRYSR